MPPSRTVTDKKHKTAMTKFDLKFAALTGALKDTKTALKQVSNQLYHLTHWAEHAAEAFDTLRNNGILPPSKKHGSDRPNHPPPPWPPLG